MQNKKKEKKKTTNNNNKKSEFEIINFFIHLTGLFCIKSRKSIKNNQSNTFIFIIFWFDVVCLLKAQRLVPEAHHWL